MKNTRQDNSSMDSSKIKLEKAFARLERAIDGKVSAVKTDEVNAQLEAAREELSKLREKNKLASRRLNNTITQIRKILGH